jgi:putative ABC transport system substrate-binding protein
LQLTQYLDDAAQGFKDSLRELGVKAAFHYLNADGLAERLPQLAEELAAKKVDLIFACSTPAAQAAKNLAADIPVVFTPVFDPLGAGLVANLEEPGGKVTGVSGMVSAAEKVRFIKDLLPEAKTIGVLYQPSDTNSLLETANFLAASQEFFEVIKLPVEKSEDLSNLLSILTENLDAVFLPIGKIIEENFPTIFYYTEDKSLPVIASHAPNVAAGALGSLVANHYLLGGKCAEQAQAILQKKAPAQIPVAFVENPEIILNIVTATSLNLKISEKILAEAKDIFD